MCKKSRGSDRRARTQLPMFGNRTRTIRISIVEFGGQGIIERQANPIWLKRTSKPGIYPWGPSSGISEKVKFSNYSTTREACML